MNMVLLNIGEYLRGRGVTNPTRQLIAHDNETPKQLPDVLLAYLVICLCNLTISLREHILVSCAV